MGVNGFNEDNISEKNKEALKSETWQRAREAMETETRHFTAEKTDGDSYGEPWAQAVKEYFRNGYKGEDKQCNVVVSGVAYQILKREGVTVFYDADGNTLFDVENERLEKEYEQMINSGAMADTEITNLECGNKEAVTTENTDKKQDDVVKDVESYSSGEEKLIAEENEMLASVKPEFKNVMQAQMDLIFKELISWSKQDSGFEKKVLLAHKSMERCMKFCADKAMGLRKPSDQEKAAARNNNIPIMTPVGSDMLFEWIKEYYDKDDKAEVEKEKKAATAQKKSADKKKAVGKKKAASKETVPRKQEKKPVEKKEDTKATGSPKKQDKFVDGQISMFDLLGV